MNSTEVIIESLKTQLKVRGLSYKELARVWKVSQSSVKRIMSSAQISLERIELACEMMDLSVGDFYRQVPFEKHTDLVFLTVEQELKLSKDPEILHYFILIQQGWGAGEIVRHYTLSPARNTQILSTLERWDLIELHPHHRIKRKYLGQLRFRKDGPLGKQMEKLVKTQFLESPFQKDDEYFTFLTLKFVPGGAQELKVRFLEFFKQLAQESDDHRHHPNAQDYGLVMAFRPWESPMTKALPMRKTRK